MNQAAVTESPAVSDRVREAMAVSLRGCEELLPKAEWERKLSKSEAAGVPLRTPGATNILRIAYV